MHVCDHCDGGEARQDHRMLWAMDRESVKGGASVGGCAGAGER